jgi:RNA polymerase subunit RPABC4/transcription elongation factor Spt4
MIAQLRRFLNQFFSRSRTINSAPLNKVSLIVIILIDIFILINVFTGLDDISRWHIAPEQAYPCYSEWKNYRSQTAKDKDYEILQASLLYGRENQFSFQQTYQQADEGHLGNVSTVCLKYAAIKDKINNSENQKVLKVIDQTQAKISKFEQANQNIRAQYDSTLLEKIAGQSRERSINSVGAEKAKQELDQNNRQISTLGKEISNLKTELIKQPEVVELITLLKDDRTFDEVEKGYEQAAFWYPSIQLAFQALFLLPLILIALSVHRFAQHKRYGLISLITWHLLVIFFIPLIFKLFEFLQVGALFQFVFDILAALLSGLIFLISYIYILLIPLVGFGIIKVLQKIVFNPKVQAASRVQKSRCARCARNIRQHDTYCPHCGYSQYVECLNCHHSTYKDLPYCKQCGSSQASDNL